MAKKKAKPTRGKKLCPKCGDSVGVRTRRCDDCGHIFQMKESGSDKASDQPAAALGELCECLREDEDLNLGDFMKSREVDLNELVKSGASQKTIENAVEQVKNQFDWSVLTAKEFGVLCGVLKKMM